MPRILVVDDNVFMRTTLRNVLTDAGYDVIAEAADGIEAIDAYRAELPDLVTLDITMPNKDGISALKELREIDPAARVVMVSAMGQEKLMIEAVTAGAADFVVKPFEPERVVQAVRKALL